MFSYMININFAISEKLDMSSAYAFDLDQAKILPFSKGLIL